MGAKSNQSQRVVGTPYLRVTRRSRYVIVFFIVGVVVLSAGILIKIWPIVKVVIKPSLLTLNEQIEIRVDLDIDGPSPATLTLPGSLLSIGQDVNDLWSNNYFTRTVKGTTIVFSQTELKFIISQALAKKLGPQAVILTDSVFINEGDWSSSDSGRLFYGRVQAGAKYYNDMPLVYWSQEIAGISHERARQILSQKSGVDNVKIIITPVFLANYSKKMPANVNDIIFTLDIN